MNVKQLETMVLNHQQQINALMSRSYTDRVECAEGKADYAKKVAALTRSDLEDIAQIIEDMLTEVEE